SIYNNYDKIIIGITEGGPRVMTREETQEIFSRVFKYLSKVELFLIKNNIDDESAIPYFPKIWDVILTGNPSVIELAKKYNWKYRFIPRSEGIGYCGTEIRKLWRHSILGEQ
ncbi:unnamed protein product, partial [marine sediment metagenome]